jgi:hypothetical protein
LRRSYQNPIGVEKIFDGCAFCQEFWIGQNLKISIRSVECELHISADVSNFRVRGLTMPRIVSAVPHGTVLFSTMMAPGFIARATVMTALSSAAKLVAAPAPIPLAFVGVLTLIKTISATAMQLSTEVEKKRFGCL